MAATAKNIEASLASQKLVPAAPAVAPKAEPMQVPEALRGYEVESSDLSRYDALCRPRRVV